MSYEFGVSSLTVDVEDWYHILDSPVAPRIEEWGSLESRVTANVERILALLDENAVQATFFWLGWIAERNKELVRRCVALGHEVASHGYGHVLAYQLARKAFGEDVRRGKAVLEDIVGSEVVGFRAAGFGIRDYTRWVFEEIRAARHTYDSSAFPGARGHGGTPSCPLEPHMIATGAGTLVEIPLSMVEVVGKRMNFFGGGYLRLAPLCLIRWGIKRLQVAGRPLIVYLHPREVDPGHPRLPLSPFRRFKSYVNLKTTLPKLEWLCSTFKFITMRELAEEVKKKKRGQATF